ncbi:PAS domain S-box protein [Achromobacter mucicolens]|uniref:sigma-54 interaction domain-containing protein n=1 Tax=Achromobacter mucicolens TaxID=1389922 RepID=UPI0007C7C358|nr:sigma 54-interacting transcriptional regulator [Achromobacter mucicolens]OAE56729.1 sigma-54-dependent Fis family transcriptional regulator [Achromobacter xylosoxidans]PTX06678.1 PAS domain S-box protein [Achromobacter mucicolens]
MAFCESAGVEIDEPAFLRLILDHVSDGLVVVDVHGRIVYINAPYCKILGGSSDEFLGRHVHDVISPHSRLPRVARGMEVIPGSPLEVRGHKLITRQVPVSYEGEIIGAVGLALFNNHDLLKKAYTLAFPSSIKVSSAQAAWNSRYSIADILGDGPSMEAFRDALLVSASHALPTMLEGETGTGKELAAQAIHSASERARGPFVWVNCASIPEHLIDAELFGYEGGAFTGASARGKPGKFELASGGTIFLDEIGDMPLMQQASLLRAIQSREIIRIGGTAPTCVDTRVICATNCDLEQAVRAGRFRQDLYYRLAMFRVRLPALRERSDLEFVIHGLLKRLCSQHCRPTRDLSTTELDLLKSHSWPGNIRELEGALLQYIYTGKIELLPTGPTKRAEDFEVPADLNLRNHLASEKRRLIAHALQVCAGDKIEAAARLGMSRASLYRELR